MWVALWSDTFFFSVIPLHIHSHVAHCGFDLFCKLLYLLQEQILVMAIKLQESHLHGLTVVIYPQVQ